MAYGDSKDDGALRDRWKTFCGRLQEAGERVFKDDNPPTPLHRADAFRFLTQNLGQAFDLAYETKDTQFPVIHAFCTPFCKLGGDNADFVYQQAWIDGRTVYRITGNKGTAPFLNFAVQGPRPEKQPGTDWPSLCEPFGDIPEANIFGHDIEAQWDGSFELYIGGPRRGPNWLPTTTGSRKMFIRQGFDRWTEEPARFRIERVGMDEPRPLPTPQMMMDAMDWAGKFIENIMIDFPDHPNTYTPGNYIKWVNQFPPEDGDNLVSDKRRGRIPQAMYWALSADEAMIIEFDNPNSLWMVTNMGVFWNSMDYLYRPVSYAPSRAKVDSDGKVRLILCPSDPGYYNWLDSQGFERGNILFRNLLSQTRTDLRTHVVKRAQLAASLPPDTVQVTHEERTQQMRERFAGILRRYCL